MVIILVFKSGYHLNNFSSSLVIFANL